MSKTTIPIQPIEAIRGRGIATQIAHRFSRDERDAFDDGWSTDEFDEPVRQDGKERSDITQVSFETAKSAISHNDSPDIYFDYGLNPYRGCEHGCVYCYARPTHSYLNLSPGLDFETKLIVKKNLPEVLARELAAKSYVPKLIAVGAATDGYQPIERDYKITRQCLEVMRKMLERDPRLAAEELKQLLPPEGEDPPDIAADEEALHERAAPHGVADLVEAERPAVALLEGVLVNPASIRPALLLVHETERRLPRVHLERADAGPFAL